MLPSYLIVEMFPRLQIDAGGGVCVEYERGGPVIRRDCADIDYLVVEPYKGVSRRAVPASPFSNGEAEFLDFYIVGGFGLSRYRILVRNGRASLRRIHDVDLFNGFVKSGEYRVVEKAFENYVREYASGCVFGCLASMALAGVSGIPLPDGAFERRGKIYHAPGLAVYVDTRGRSNTIVEIAASAQKAEDFREITTGLFKEAYGVHWAYMGRLLALSPSMLLDLFLSSPRRAVVGPAL
ncbi:hypothetical protein TUZN_1810 [Thermoproteus uzoniensis 768-20]|uniref:Uncharacterized protein n=1 Tax=Thermoproteus uzoniensis (strain 768-20) TaxID=999630 RepID=F2L3V8_THEU7|nr:hypothetical protein [Thermoproteus uzoniensis]AEA13270.1 hypothetical protein TUZN_1810 [Thermoproteus uzoniensis 768-20]